MRNIMVIITVRELSRSIYIIAVYIMNLDQTDI